MEQSPLLRALKEYFEREALLQKKPPSLDHDPYKEVGMDNHFAR